MRRRTARVCGSNAHDACVTHRSVVLAWLPTAVSAITPTQTADTRRPSWVDALSTAKPMANIVSASGLTTSRLRSTQYEH